MGLHPVQSLTKNRSLDETQPPTEDTDDEREPFHLDDLELAKRLVPDRGLPSGTTSTPQRPFRLAVLP